MTLSYEAKTHLIFLAALILLLVGGGVGLRSISRLSDEAARVRSSQQNLTALASLLSGITDAETGSRGYTLTGDEAYLRPSEDAGQRVRDRLGELKELAGADAPRLATLQELQTLTDQRLALSARMVELRRDGGFEPARDATAQGEGKRLHDRIREIVGALQSAEQERLGRRDLASQAATRRARGFMVVACLIGAVFVGVGLRRSRRDLAARREAEASLQSSLQQLEQRVAERTAELGRSEARLRLALDAARLGVFDWDVRSDRIDWSPWHEQIWGFAPGSFDGTYAAFDSRIHPDDRAGLGEEVVRCRETGARYIREFRVVWPDATVRWVAAAGEFERAPGGEVIRMHGVVQDVTDRKQAEIELIDRKAALELGLGRLRTALDAANAGHWEWEPATGKLYWSPEIPRLYGLAPDAAPDPSYEAWRATVHPDDIVQVERMLLESVRTQSLVDLEWRVRTHDGQLRWLMSRGRPIRHTSLAESRYFGVVIDITERKRIEENALRWQRIFEFAGFGLASASLTDNVFLDVNEAFARERGYTRQELIGRRIVEVYPLAHREEMRERLARIDAAGHLVYESVHQRKDGSTFPVLMEVTLVRDAAGQAVSRVAYALDITERRKAADALCQRNEELTRFVYTVSHDLKSPLVTIRTFLGYLERDLASGDTARVASDMGFMQRAAEKMSALLDELLELSRVGRGAHAAVEIPLDRLVREALDMVAGTIAERGVEVVVTAPPLVVVGDARRLLEVFQNLVDNAVKFMGSQTHPRIEIGAEETAEGIVLFVRDNGMGIDPRHHAKLFGLFEKLHPDTPGSGIGLALVQRIVEVHGGRVWAESAGPGTGATFRFTLANTRRPEPT